MLECPDLLFSYAILDVHANLARACRGLWGHGPKLLIDSGGFSAYRSGAVVDLKAYTAFCREHESIPNCWGCIQLDEPGNAEGTARNLDTMVADGARPMPVLTVDMPVSRVRAFADINPRIAMAGGLGVFTGASDWAVNRFLAAKQAAPHGEFHGLGFVRWRFMFRCGLTSVDASSHARGARYGDLSVFRPNQGLTAVPHRKVLHLPRAQLPPAIAELLEASRVTVDQWRDERWFRYGNLTPLAVFSSYAALLQWRYARTQGLTVFQAIGQPRDFWRFAIAVKHGRSDGKGVDLPAAERTMVLWRSKPNEWRIDAALDIIRSHHTAAATRQAHKAASPGTVLPKPGVPA